VAEPADDAGEQLERFPPLARDQQAQRPIDGLIGQSTSFRVGAELR
jgi:hypothetical protein